MTKLQAVRGKKKCQHNFWFLGLVKCEGHVGKNDFHETADGYGEWYKKYQCDSCFKTKYKEAYL